MQRLEAGGRYAYLTTARRGRRSIIVTTRSGGQLSSDFCATDHCRTVGQVFGTFIEKEIAGKFQIIATLCFTDCVIVVQPQKGYALCNNDGTSIPISFVS